MHYASRVRAGRHCHSLVSRPPSVSLVRSASMMISRESVDSFCARTCLRSIACSLLSKNRGTCAVGFCSHHRSPAGYRTMRLQCIRNCSRSPAAVRRDAGEAEEKDPKQPSEFRRIPRPPRHYLHRSAVQRDRSPPSVLVLTSDEKCVLIFFSPTCRLSFALRFAAASSTPLRSCEPIC